ncbi:hypothetical protein A2Z67_05250 [Candidatus Woesebacteria bacterium RBG_13_36_22]|uniref:Uncharacterized protein n=1 Tax=Candidatus Woesebacteria bacterium RBG_13_36_22 TaxID=1802478 RepID=A0A1F7X3P3_9BACT|nr:MAG: hypothetical protein A2Z67_05250 [Candidatus Woesebacteria bacterium RBG_13_36_22]
MEKDLIAVKESIMLVSADKEVNDMLTEQINQKHDCFARAYLEGHPECRQCVVIAEFKDFDTGEFRREPLWVVCSEACRFLSDATAGVKSNEKIEVHEEVTEEMQEITEQIATETETETKETSLETATEPKETVVETKPEVQEKRPRRKSVIEGHSKTLYCSCSKCGRKVSAYESTFNNRLRYYGSLEELNKRYLCRKCRKEASGVAKQID